MMVNTHAFTVWDDKTWVPQVVSIGRTEDNGDGVCFSALYYGPGNGNPVPSAGLTYLQKFVVFEDDVSLELSTERSKRTCSELDEWRVNRRSSSECVIAKTSSKTACG